MKDNLPTPSFGDLLAEVMDLTGGLAIIVLPLFALSVPAIALFVLLPGILLLALAAPFAVLGALLAAPYLLVRRVTRRSGRPR
jgi:hypothetical protein